MKYIVDSKKLRSFRAKVKRFYSEKKRNLPWRNNVTPYNVWVSEVMLQQTQVSRVLQFYNRFIEELPDCSALSNSSDRNLLLLWQGLGYNSRAIRMKRAAQIVVEKYNGVLPINKNDLLMLPGIGDYTASAIITFSQNIPLGFFDTNIRRVLIYELELPEDITANELNEVALQICPKNEAREWYYALFDFGALHLTASKTGIKSISKQSAFKGSIREIRSKILRLLLTEESLKRAHLYELIPDKRTDEIVKQMLSENIIYSTEQNGAEHLFIA